MYVPYRLPSRIAKNTIGKEVKTAMFEPIEDPWTIF